MCWKRLQRLKIVLKFEKAARVKIASKEIHQISKKRKNFRTKESKRIL